jgi:hypothetical protein
LPLDFFSRKAGVSDDVKAIPKERRHPSVEIEGLQISTGMAEGAQIMNHHDLRDQLSTQVALRRRCEDQRGPLQLGKTGKLKLSPNQAL